MWKCVNSSESRRMEHNYSEELPRDEIMRILKERELKITDIEHLPDNELKRIYTIFALPLEKREKTKCSHSTNNPYSEQLESKPTRAPKRQFDLDVNLSHLNLHGNGLIIKRNKLSNDEHTNLKQFLFTEDINHCSRKARQILA